MFGRTRSNQQIVLSVPGKLPLHVDAKARALSRQPVAQCIAFRHDVPRKSKLQLPALVAGNLLLKNAKATITLQRTKSDFVVILNFQFSELRFKLLLSQHFAPQVLFF